MRRGSVGGPGSTSGGGGGGGGGGMIELSVSITSIGISAGQIRILP